MEKQRMHIGVDDTDSTRKGCTTYVAALLVEKLEQMKVKFLDYPNLIRLNPNVPWKTRGNGALCIRIECKEGLANQLKQAAIRLVKEQADLSFEGTNPGIVFLSRTTIPEEITCFAKKAVSEIVTLKAAMRLVKKVGGEALGFNNGRGIIGALAAIGETLQNDCTYELIAYRTPENRGSKRKVDETSIFEMDKLTQPYTFNNVDMKKGRVIITPRGPDPVLLGIRGETPEIVRKAFGLVKPLEQVERWLIFRTNQGTDAHLKQVHALSRIRPYNSVVVKGVVSKNPRIVPVRHVIFSIRDESGEVDCAAYEPTDVLRRAAANLLAGDRVEVSGAVREPSQEKPLTLNLEKIRILSLTKKIWYQNPICPKCGKRLKSMGKNQGFKCGKCGLKPAGFEKTAVSVNRKLEKKMYVTSPRSQRHLTKPLRRYGMEKCCRKACNMISNWYSF